MNARKAFSRIGLGLALTMILVQALQFAIIKLTKHYDSSLFNTAWYNYALSCVTYYFIGFPFFSLIVKKLPNSSNNNKNKFKFSHFLMIIAIGFATVYLVNLFTTLLLLLFSLITKNPISNPVDQIVSNSTWYITIPFVVIIAPIFEELMFRGVIINKLHDYGDTAAIVTSAILFGLFHGNFSQCFYATALGLILGYLRVRSGSIKYSILLHMCINLMGGVIGPGIVKHSSNYTLLMLFSFFIISLITLGVTLFILNIKNIKLNKGIYVFEKGTAFTTTCINVGMIFYFVLILTIMIYSLFI